MPKLAEIYKSNGWERDIFNLGDAPADIRSMFEIEESFEFKY